jgi:hypothetical protein
MGVVISGFCFHRQWSRFSAAASEIQQSSAKFLLFIFSKLPLFFTPSNIIFGEFICSVFFEFVLVLKMAFSIYQRSVKLFFAADGNGA